MPKSPITTYRFRDRFLADLTIRTQGLRWARAYGLTTAKRWDEGRWTGAMSWAQVLQVSSLRLMRCRYGQRPEWLERHRALVVFLKLCALIAPTVSGRHERSMIRAYPDIARRGWPALLWYLIAPLFGAGQDVEP
jgi:hypothetical protein